MRFSTASSARKSADDDWFDLVLDQDTPLYIDPFLVFDDRDPAWSGCHAEVVSFFETAAQLALAAGGDRNTAAWRKAVRLLMFPEPHEFALGVGLGSPRGSGTGLKFAMEIAGVLQLLGTSRLPNIASIGGFALFCDGIGMDRISDILGNILKQRFVEYTSTVNSRHQLTTKLVNVQHSSWDAKRGNWTPDRQVALFPNPATGGGVLLTPERFLKEIPRVEPDQFWDWAGLNQAAILRDDLNYDLSETLTRSDKIKRARKVAWSRPEVAIRYLDKVSGEAHLPYDVEQDPKRLVGWLEDGAQAALLLPPDSAATNPPVGVDGLNDWVLRLAEDFKFVIENTEAWKLLWTRPGYDHVPERLAQVFAAAMWRSQCKAANVAIGKEVNMGRGPVDFSFSQGWTRRALLEMKYIGSSHFFSGASKQLPQYLLTEQVDFGVYLAIGFEDNDFKRARVKQVEETCRAIATKKGMEIKLVVVDARPATKQSASKL